MERNVNDPEFQEEKGKYRDKKDEEEEIIPVEYLGFIQKTRKARVAHFIWGFLLIIVLLGIAPSMKGQDICPRCGQTRSSSTLAWGHWHIVGIEPADTTWTDWYVSLNPEDHNHHWVRTGNSHPGLFIYLSTSFSVGDEWQFPINLVERMEELDNIRYFRPGKVLDIPRVLLSVNNGKEWDAIIGPLTVGTAQDASNWWNSHKNELTGWSAQPIGSPLPEDFLAASAAYVEEMNEPDGNLIPLIH